MTIDIDKDYDVVLTYSPIIEMTGHIFECFDYYLFLRQHFNKVGVLFFNSLSKEKLKISWQSKYTVPFEDAEHDIMLCRLSEKQHDINIVMFGKKTKVLLTDGNIKNLEQYKILLHTKKLFGFLCFNEQFENVKTNKNIVFLQDYRIYQQNKHFKSIDYVKKIPFQFYKKYEKTNGNIGLMYMTHVCRKVQPSTIETYHKLSGCEKTLLLVPYKLPEYDKIDNVEQIVIPLDSLFSKFDTYIYTPIKRHFDCSPRFVTECFYYGKKVFKQLDYFDVGLEIRYNDCIENMEKITLNGNDEIVEILSNVD